MNPFRWLRQRFDRAAIKAARTGNRGIALVAEYLANLMWLFETTWTDLVKEGYGKNGVVYACVRFLCQSIAEARLTAYDSDDPDKRKELPHDHPLRLLIKRPNELMTEFEFIELTTIQMAVVGRSVWWKERGRGGGVIALWPLRPDRVAPIYSASEKPGERVLAGYAYLPPDGNTPIPIPRRDCIAFNFPDPDGESGGIVEGFGPVAAISRQIAADNTATQHVGSLLANYAIPGVAIKLQESVDEEEARLIKAKFRQEFGGSRLGTPAVVGAGAEIEALGFSLRDLEFPDLRANAEARICAAFGIPAVLVGVWVGLKEANQRATVKEMREAFAETTCSWYWRRYSEQITLDLAYEFDEAAVIEFDTSKVRALAGQLIERLQPIKDAFQAGVVTVNGYRAELGLDPLDPPVGDVLYIPAGVTVTPVTPEAKAALDKIAEENMARQQEMVAQQPKQLPAGRDEEDEEEEPAAKGVKHLAGQHDQSTHGRGGGSGSVGTHVASKVTGVETEALTGQEQRAVLAYGGSSFRNINSALRTGAKPSERDQAIMEGLDSAIAKGQVTRDMTVYRGFQSPNVEANWANLKPGTTIGERAYMSTTISSTVARRFLQDERGIIAEIRVPKGTRATTLDIAGLGGEGELLLGRQTRMRLVRKGKDSYGNKLMVLEVIA